MDALAERQLLHRLTIEIPCVSFLRIIDVKALPDPRSRHAQIDSTVAADARIGSGLLATQQPFH